MPGPAQPPSGGRSAALIAPPPGAATGALVAPLSDAEFAALMAPLGPFGASPFLAAGVSGGADSLALALLAGAWAWARGGRLLALVVDHGLRPESGAEAQAVAGWLGARGMAVQVLALALAPGTAVQARARAARHAALLAACRAAGAPWLLLGHHRADQAETVLFRALRGSGPAGLAAMAPARPQPEALVLRPLLGTPPARLAAVVAAAGMRPVRDPSNADPRFTRPRLRAALADPGGTGGTVAALAAAAAGFGARRARHSAAIAARLAVAAVLRPEGWAEVDPVALAGDAVADGALGWLVQALGGAGFPPAAAAVAALRRRGVGTLGGVWLRPAAGRWRLGREGAAVAPPVPAVAGVVWDGRFRLRRAVDPALRLGALGAAQAARLRGWAPGLPAAVLAAMPAFRDDAALVAVPGVGYGPKECADKSLVVFAPAAIPNDTGMRLALNRMANGSGHSLLPGATLSSSGLLWGDVPCAPASGSGRGRERDNNR